jgi:hypothetical protein
MAKTKVIRISQLLDILVKEIEKGNTNVTLYGYIADESNNNNLIVSDKEAFEEQSFAEWQLERNGF